jgi:hypothetical protein
MTDKDLWDTIKEDLETRNKVLEIVQDLVDLMYEEKEDAFFSFSYSLTEIRNKCVKLPDNLKKLPFIQCLQRGNIEYPKEVLDTARDFLYADLISTIKE